jgi:predicted RNA methylase
VADVLRATETSDGYVLVLGVGTGRLAEEVVRQSKCDVIAIDPDAEKVARLRKQFTEAGLYGSRISIYVGDFDSCVHPPLTASLILS